MSQTPQFDTVALVLGAAVWPGGTPSPTLRRRAEHAAKLYATGHVDAIIGCGGLGQHPPSEAQVIAQICRDSGVPDGALFLEDRSTTTRENLTYARPILQRLNAAKVVIVTDAYHAPRARILARQSAIRASTNTPPLFAVSARQLLRNLPREALAIAAIALRLR